LNTHQQPRSTEDINFTCKKEPRPVMLSKDLPTNSTTEAKKKTKFNLSTTIKALKLKLI